MVEPRLGIVIPALNEEVTIARVVAGARSHGVVIVVDDGSTDRTSALAAGAGAVVVRHEANRGYDRALDSGFAAASQMDLDAVVTLDGDGQHNPGQIVEMIKALGTGADIVVGRRDRMQRLGEKVFGLVSASHWRISDPLCGMKAYRMSVYRDYGCFDSYGSIGTELALQGAAKGLRIVEVPVLTRDRADAPRFGRKLAANGRIFRALAKAVQKWW